MRIPSPALAAAAALAAILWPLPSAVAQTGAAQPTAPVAASGVPPAKPETKLLTPAEKRDSATAAGDLRPEHRVTPQVSIPLSKTQPASPKSLLTPAPRTGTATAPSGGIDDAAARCGALADAQAREQCRDKLSR